MEWKLTKWYVFLWWILIGFILTVSAYIFIPSGSAITPEYLSFWLVLISLTIFFTGIIYAVVCFVAWIVLKIKK